MIIGDTQTIGFSNLTGGSRVTFASAMVATASCEKVIGQLKDRAAQIWKIDAEAVKWALMVEVLLLIQVTLIYLSNCHETNIINMTH